VYRFKDFINEAMNPFADKNPIGGGGMGGGGFAPKSRMAPAARMPDNSIVAGKPGDAHSDLIPRLAGKDTPKELGFVRSHPGENYKGNTFLSREKASEVGKRNPNLLNDPDQAKDPPWQAQSYDFKPESGKARKKIVSEKKQTEGGIGQDMPYGSRPAPSSSEQLSTLSRSLGNTSSSSGQGAPKNNLSQMRPSDNVKDWRTPYHDSPLYNEGGKARKKIKEAIDYILEKEDKAKKKKPATKKDNKGKLGVANKESMHGGKAFYGPGEC